MVAAFLQKLQKARQSNRRIAGVRIVTDEMDIIGVLKEGNRHHQAGRLEAAMALYEEVLRQHSQHADALHLSGLVTHQMGDSDEAIRRIKMAIRRQPRNTVYKQNLCSILSAAGRIDEGIALCEALLREAPQSPEMMALLGRLYIQRKAWGKAADLFEAMVARDAGNAELWFHLGVACQEGGRLETAIDAYRRALQIQPQLAEAHYNLANALRMHRGMTAQVIESYRAALAIRPDYVDAGFNLAKALETLHRLDEAVDAYALVLRSQPGHVETLNGLGNVCMKLGRHQKAVDAYQQAVRYQPDFSKGYFNLALASKLHGRLQQAEAYARQALEQEPHSGDALSLMVQILQQACRWKDLEEYGHKLDEVTQMQLAAGQRPSEQPFLHFARHADPLGNLAVARAWSDATAAGKSPLAIDSHRSSASDGKLIVGYLSERFRNAATAHLMLQLFGLHDRDRFAVYAYSYGKDDRSSYRRRLEKDADRFIDIRQLGDEEAAKRIHGDGVHILVDLMGYMQHNRMGILASRPAPLQVAYLGYPGTTGAGFMDYLIADGQVIPDGEEACYREAIVRLPHCYQLNDNTQTVATRTFDRRTCHLPEEAFVFCSFNTDYKIDAQTFGTWMRIMHKVPGSVLWLLVRSPATRQNLEDAASVAGVDPKRLVFAESMPKAEHLARIPLADLALDTLTVNGHTTTSDCLWVDVPVVTVKGKHFSSRVSASLLQAVGLHEMVCESIEAYERLAVRLATDPQEHLNVRKQLAENRLRFPLFDTPKTVRSLEAAYQEMWARYIQGKRPQSFPIAPQANNG